MQAKSLYEDNDLELSNNFTKDELELINKGKKSYLHISPTARDNKLYSWHPFGLPIYLSLLPPDNLVLRHLLLGLLSGLGAAGLLILCRQLNITLKASLLVTTLLCLSSIWGIYSSRALPELPGAVLTIWTSIALFGLYKHPWRSAFLLILCCGYLPFLHQRFVPISFTGYLFFLIFLLSNKGLQRWKLFSVTTIGLGVLALLYFYLNLHLYTTAISYSSSQFSFYPAGMWKILTTDRSITYIQPAFAWMFSASVLCLISKKQIRRYMLFTLSSFFLILLISCSNAGWTGGSSTMGRFLVVVLPLLVPPAAYIFERTNAVAKWWFLFLSLISVAYYYFLLARLPEFGTSFGDPRLYIGYVYDYLKGLLNPFPYSETVQWYPFFGKNSYMFPVFLFSFTFILLLQNGKTKTSLLNFAFPAIIVISAVSINQETSRQSWDDFDERRMIFQMEYNAHLFMEHIATSYNLIPGKINSSFSLFQGFNAQSKHQHLNLASVTNTSSTKNGVKNIVFQQNMPPNDWYGRNYFWTTLGKKFSSIPVKTAFYLTGELVGEVEAELVIVEMGGKSPHLLLSKKIGSDGHRLSVNINSFVQPTGDGVVHILIRISSGEGTFYSNTIGWAPASPVILQKTQASLPKDFSMKLTSK